MAFAVNGTDAMPEALVATVMVAVLLLKRPDAPLAGAANVTFTPAIGLFAASLTVTASALVNAVLTVALCGVPPVAVTDATATPFCVTVIDCPSTVICATRATVAVFAVKEKLIIPFEMEPMVSQLWSLVGAKIPVRLVVAGSTCGSESDPAAPGSVMFEEPTKA